MEFNVPKIVLKWIKKTHYLSIPANRASSIIIAMVPFFTSLHTGVVGKELARETSGAEFGTAAASVAVEGALSATCAVTGCKISGSVAEFPADAEVGGHGTRTSDT